MKHWSKWIVSLLLGLLLIQPTSVMAQSVTMTLSAPSTIQRGNEFTVTVGVSNAPLVYGIDAAISYDRSKITFVRAEGLNGFTQPTVGIRFNSTNNAGRRGTYSMVRFVFRASSAFVVGDTTTIRFTDVKLSDLSKELSGNNLSWSITMINPPLSSNTSLKSLVISDLDFDFNPETTSYQLEVGNEVNQLVITAEPADQNATTNIQPIYPLEVGENKIDLVVTAQNNATKTYEITINRSDQVPTVSIDKLVDAIQKITTPEIQLIAPDDGVLENDMLQVVKEANKTLIVLGVDEHQELRYQWRVIGASINQSVTLRTLVSFISDNQAQMDIASNHVKGITLSFQSNPTLPEQTSVGIFVDNLYQDGQSLNLYRYDQETNTFSLTTTSLLVEAGWVWIPLSTTSEYFLTAATIEDPLSINNIWMMIAIAQTVMIGVLLILLLKKKKSSIMMSK